MRRAVLLLLLAAAAAVAAFAEDSGSLAVICPERFSVTIDGAQYGETTAAEQGKIVESIVVGKHRLQVQRQGYTEQAFDIVIQKNKTTIIRVDPQAASFQVKKQSEEAVQLKERVGTLSVRSLPLEAAFFIDGKRIGTTNSDITDFPSGAHEIEFRREGKSLRARFTLEGGDKLDILASFLRMEVKLSSALADARVADEAKRRAQEEQQRQEAERKAAADREKAFADLVNNSTCRIAVRNIPSFEAFIAYVAATRTANAWVTPPGTGSSMEIGGLGKVQSFAGHFWYDIGRQSTLRDAASYEKWIRTPKYGRLERVDVAATGPTPIPFRKLVHMGDRSSGFFIHYTESFSVMHMFKTQSDDYEWMIDCLVDEREVELRPGTTTVWVDIAIRNETLEIRVAEVENENPLAGTKERVTY